MTLGEYQRSSEIFSDPVWYPTQSPGSQIPSREKGQTSFPEGGIFRSRLRRRHLLTITTKAEGH